MNELTIKLLIAYYETLDNCNEYETFTRLINKLNDLGVATEEHEKYINAVLEAVKPKEDNANLYAEMLKQAHILVAGASGSGKSVVINGFVNEVLNTFGLGCMFYLCDPKKVELAIYKKLPQTIAYSDNDSGMLEVLKDALKLIDMRYKEMQKRNLKKYADFPAYVIIDEFADLMTTNRKNALPLIQRIAQIGRAANVHLIIGTQSAKASGKAGLDTIKSNMSCKVALKCTTKQDSRNIIGVSGAELLPPYGKCILDTGIDQKIVTVPYIEDDIINATVNAHATHNTLLYRLTNKRY